MTSDSRLMVAPNHPIFTGGMMWFSDAGHCVIE
jgi:hypothetical protein